MAGLSTLAETLQDYAITIAKRNGNETVGDLHLLAAILQWEETEFEDLFPGQSGRVNESLASIRGDALSRPILEPNTVENLAKVNVSTDAWDLARNLISGLSDQPSRRTRTPIRAKTDSAPTVQEEAQEESEEIGATATQLLLTAALVERISSALSQPLRQVAEMVSLDAVYAASMVLGGELPPAVIDGIGSSIGIEDLPTNSNGALSNLVRDVAHSGLEGAGRLGTELALALVDVCEWVAALDEQITREETDHIDGIRLQLRDQLGDNINAESDAFLSFDRQFDQLVGMKDVKDELRKRVEFLVVARRREARGFKSEVQRSHIAFLGNPGTGKTTVARLYGQLLHDVGLLPSDKFVETDRAGLVGQYIGHTEEKTMKTIDQADGGVLFIDEAYALADNYGADRKGFGAEATDVLVKQMEDRRDNLVVIVAGYSKPMQQFLSINPGLRSRIPVLLEFPDYSNDELVEIAERIANRRELTLLPEAKEKISTIMEKERQVEGFGNAREVENLLDAAQRNLVARMAKLGNLATFEESSTVLPADLPESTELVVKRPIGFTARANL
jgi:hypothetical protein